MHARLLTTALVGLMLTCAACQPGTGMPPAATGQSSTIASTTLTGRVLVPASIIAAGGGNIIAAGGGNLTRYVLATGVAEAPLPNAEVYLADASGNPLPNMKPIQTDAEGRYTFPTVSAGYAFLVVAKAKGGNGQELSFETIAKATDLGATADISAATTLAAASVVETSGGSLSGFNPARFRTVAEATARNLTEDRLPNFANRGDVLKRMNELAETVSEIRSSLDSIKQELSEVKAQLAELQGKLDKLGSQPGQDGGIGECTEFFKQLDADANGRVTLSEWIERLRIDTGGEDPKEIFISVDRDMSGDLTDAEFVPACEQHKAGGQHEGEGSCEEGFPFMDKDRDGAVSLEEFKQGHRPSPDGMSPPAEDLFRHADADRNGRLSSTEWASLCQGPSDHQEGGPPTAEECSRHFRFMDRNSDGRVDLAEYKVDFRPAPDGNGGTAEDAFRYFDADRNGALSETEYVPKCSEPPQPHSEPEPGHEPGCDEKFRFHDQNADGRISLDELRATFEHDTSGATPAEVYGRWDHNADGTVSRDEFIAMCEGQAPATSEPTPSPSPSPTPTPSPSPTV